MPPKNSRAKPVVDAPAGGSDPAGKTSPSKGKEIVDNIPSEVEVTAGSSGLTLEEKLKALATVVSDDSFIEDDSDEELDIDATKSSYPHLRFTAILLFSVIPSREVASVILTVKTLMKRVWSNLLTDDVLASVKFQELLPAIVAKTRYSRLQVSFLHESDAVNIKQTTVEHKRQNGTTLYCFWLHQEDAAYLRKKASSPQLLEVFFKNVPADIPPELVKEIMVAHPLKIRKQSAFAEGHCFHRVLHPVHGKSFMVAADHITSASHLLGLEKLGAATRGRLNRTNIHLDAFHVTLLAVYFPADVTDRKHFISRVLRPVVDAVHPGAHLLIVGDFNLVEDPLLDRTSKKGTSKENDFLYQRCSVLNVPDAFRVLHPYRREFTFYSCANQSSSRIDRVLVSQSLLSHVEFASHIMPADPISDHSFAVKAAFRMNTKVQMGPGLWRLLAYLIGRPGVRKVIEVVEKQVAANGDDFELLLSRLNVGLRAYAMEERKRIRATMAHLQRTIADLKQAWLGDPSCARLKELLDEREAQLKSYRLARQQRLHVMAGVNELVMGEVASPHLSAKIRSRKEKT
ncbi:unnamed protein product [Closterium sp. NIES-64]|nr:unnamed protein product [Closterium sp. NIES-64]